MHAGPRRLVLPRFTLTETAEGPGDGVSKIALRDGTFYYVRDKFTDAASSRVDGKPDWVSAAFDRFPIVLKGNGEPWDEVNIWILMRLEGQPQPEMETFLGIAEDLTYYCRFLEEHSLDWLTFPQFKLRRPTYRYNGHLKTRLQLGEISVATAKRRMSRVVNFYRFMMQAGLIALGYPPWNEKEVYVQIDNPDGQSGSMKVTTTDVGIKVAKQDDPFDETIDDGGRLRPLPANEQSWLLEALLACDHTETILIHALALATGARIQTILTFRVKTVQAPIQGSGLVRILAGPHRGHNTGIDTKNNKCITLQVPAWLYADLQTYVQSERAKSRRQKAPGGDHPEQYLFLSPHGTPLYVSKQDHNYGDRLKRHKKRGQTVRAYIAKYVIPHIRREHSPTFNYQFHDLRATFGMNLMDAYKQKIQAGEITYTAALNIVSARMCHASPVITERYFNYRDRLKLAYAGQDGWEDELQRMMQIAMVRQQ